MAFRAVPASRRVCFPTVGALGWGCQVVVEDGLDISPAGARRIRVVFGLHLLEGAEWACEGICFAQLFDMSIFPAFLALGGRGERDDLFDSS